MEPQKVRKSSFLAVAIVLAAFSVNGAEEHVLSIGRATNQVSLEHQRLDPIVTFLASRLEKDGVVAGEVVLKGKNSDIAIRELLDKGELDLIIESPFSAANYQRHSDVAQLVQVEREGVLEYNSRIFVRDDSGIDSLAGLKGKVIAFEDPTSTSAYRWPRRTLEKKGYVLLNTESVEAIPEDAIGYMFAGSELNIASSVFFKKVSAGCLSSADWSNPEENPTSFRKNFRVIHDTDFIPRMVVMVNNKISDRLRQRLLEELFAMHQSQEGREALKKYKIDRFWPVTDKVTDLINKLAGE